MVVAAASHADDEAGYRAGHYNPGQYQQRLIDETSIVGAYSSDLSAFRARGGKIILMMG